MERRGERHEAAPPTPHNWFLPLWEATKKKAIDQIAAMAVVAMLAGSAGVLTTWAWFKNAVALNDVVGCVANVKTWLDQERFFPQVFVAGWSGSLILTELLIKEYYNEEVPHPPMYVLYELPEGSKDEKYNTHGTKFVSSSTETQFFIPHAIEGEERNKNILIFTDWVNTGNTLHQTREELKKMKFTQVKTAVVAANKITLQKPPDRICFLVREPWDKLPWPPRRQGF